MKSAALNHIRPNVRSQHPYRVGDPEGPIAVKLNQNESPFDVPGRIKSRLLEMWAAVPLNRYPAEHPKELTAALAAHLDWDETGIIVGNGSNELMYAIGMACVGAGTAVVLPRPMFAFYEKVARLYNGRVVSVPPKADFSLDVESCVEQANASHAALTVLATPNNPTGLALPVEEVRQVAAAAPGVLLVDEAYVEFSSQGSARSLLDAHENLILLRTFSKAYGLAGLRIGYLVGHPALMGELMKARVPFTVDRLAAAAAVMLLEESDLIRERVDHMRSETARLHAALASMDSVHALPTDANFVTFRPTTDSQLVFSRLQEAGVLVRDMGGYRELGGFLRVCAGTAQENNAFLKALAASLR